MYQKVRNISEIFTVFITQILKGKAIINKNFLYPYQLKTEIPHYIIVGDVFNKLF